MGAFPAVHKRNAARQHKEKVGDQKHLVKSMCSLVAVYRSGGAGRIDTPDHHSVEGEKKARFGVSQRGGRASAARRFGRAAAATPAATAGAARAEAGIAKAR